MSIKWELGENNYFEILRLYVSKLYLLISGPQETIPLWPYHSYTLE